LQFDSISKDEAIDFVRIMHDLLMDTASHITQLRVDNMFQGAGISGQAPRLSDSAPAPLVDLKIILEHVSLRKSMVQVGRRDNNRRRKAHPPRSTPTSDTGKSNPITPVQQFKPRQEQQRKGFHSNNSQKEKGKQSGPAQ
jgi:hypothetical protein